MKNLKQLFADDPEILRILENKDKDGLLKSLSQVSNDKNSQILERILQMKGAQGEKGEPGHTPEKGIDYLTEEEISSLIDDIAFKAKPEKGVDYFTPKEIERIKESIINIIKPIKGRDYFDGQPGAKGESGYTPIKGKDYFDGNDGKEESPLEIVKRLNTLEGELEPNVIKGFLTIDKLVKEIKDKKLIEPRDIKGMPLDFSDLRWHGGGLSTVSHDATLSGNGTPASPLSVISSGGVTSLNTLTGAVTLSAGSNITITPSGNTLIIAATGSGTVTSVSTDSTLTGGPITTTGTLGVNLSHPNSWLGVQTFGNNISLGGSQLSVTSLTTNDVLQYNGVNWVNVAASTIGGVTSVSNSDGTLTISPTTGAVVASLNRAHANIWTGQQTFTATSSSTIGVIIKGAVSQSSALQDWQNNGGTSLLSVSSAGILVVSAGVRASPSIKFVNPSLSGDNNGMFLYNSGSDSSGEIVMRGNPVITFSGAGGGELRTGGGNQSVHGGNHTLINSATTTLNWATQQLTNGNWFVATGKFGINKTTTLGAQLDIVTDSSSTIGEIIKASASQSVDLIQLQNSSAGILASFSQTGQLTLGLAGTQTGILKFKGTTSGTVTLTTADAAGTWTMKLPTIAGTSGYVLRTDGTGVTSWVPQTSATTPGGGDGDIQFNNGGSAFGGATHFQFFPSNEAVKIGPDSYGLNTLTQLSVNSYSDTMKLLELSRSGVGVDYSLLPHALNYRIDGTIFSFMDGQGGLTLGATGTGTWLTLKSTGGTGSFNLRPYATGTDWTMVMPADGGTSGYLLSTDGSGNTSWIDTPPAVAAGSAGQIQFHSGSGSGLDASSRLTWNGDELILRASDDNLNSAIQIRQSNNADYGVDFMLDQDDNGGFYIAGVDNGVKTKTLKIGHITTPSASIINGNFGIGNTFDANAIPELFTISAPDDSSGSALAIRQSNNLAYGFDILQDQNVGGETYFAVVEASAKTNVLQFTRTATNYAVSFLQGNVGFKSTGSPTALGHFGAATTSVASLRITDSVTVDVSAPNSGDMWWNGTNLYFYNGATNVDLLAGGGGTPAGSDTWVQFNDGGSAFGAVSGFNFNKVTNSLCIGASSGFALLDIVSTDAAFPMLSLTALSLTQSADIISIVNTNSGVAFRVDPLGNLFLGTVGGDVGAITMHNAGSFSVTLSTQNTTAADYTFALPVDGGTTGYLLATDGMGNTSWTLPGITAPGGNDLAIQFNNSGALDGDESYFAYDVSTKKVSIGTNSGSAQLNIQGTNASNVLLSLAATAGQTEDAFQYYDDNLDIRATIDVNGQLILGKSSTYAGFIKLQSVSTGGVSITTQSTAADWTLALPVDSGSNNFALLTDGSGNTSWGQVPLTSSSADLTAQTATVTNVTSSTSPNDGNAHTYVIGGYVLVTATTASTVTMQVAYTDQNNNAQTANFFGEGLTTAALSGVGPSTFPPITVRVKANTTITLKSTVTGVSITYDVGGFIQKVN